MTDALRRLRRFDSGPSHQGYDKGPCRDTEPRQKLNSGRQRGAGVRICRCSSMAEQRPYKPTEREPLLQGGEHCGFESRHLHAPCWQPGRGILLSAYKASRWLSFGHGATLRGMREVSGIHHITAEQAVWAFLSRTAAAKGRYSLMLYWPSGKAAVC